MVKEYLEKTRDSFIEEKSNWVEKVYHLQNSMKENIKMISLLEDTNDPNFEAFTPRQVNGYNKNKIIELQEEQKKISEELQEARTIVSQYDLKILEVESVLRVEKGQPDNSFSKSDIDDLNSKMKFQLLESVERERQRISRDLHDSTVQNLTSLVHKTELCMKLLDVDTIRCKLELSTMSSTLRTIIDDTRKMIYDLRPMSFDDIGFDITVERALDHFKKLNNINVSHKTIGEPYAFDQIIGLTLLRVIQEACNNAVKHANAENISVVIDYRENQLCVEIKDDGVGFDMDLMPEHSREDNSGFGLSMMKERIYLLSGDINVISSPGNGCKIKVEVPISK